MSEGFVRGFIGLAMGVILVLLFTFFFSTPLMEKEINSSIEAVSTKNILLKELVRETKEQTKIFRQMLDRTCEEAKI